MGLSERENEVLKKLQLARKPSPKIKGRALIIVSEALMDSDNYNKMMDEVKALFEREGIEPFDAQINCTFYSR